MKLINMTPKSKTMHLSRNNNDERIPFHKNKVNNNLYIYMCLYFVLHCYWFLYIYIIWSVKCPQFHKMSDPQIQCYLNLKQAKSQRVTVQCETITTFTNHTKHFSYDWYTYYTVAVIHALCVYIYIYIYIYNQMIKVRV